MPVPFPTQDDLKRSCRGLIDSEYNALCDFTADDLYDYLASVCEITRETSDELYEEMF